MKLIRSLSKTIAKIFECDKVSVHPDSISRTGNYRR